MGLGAFKDLEKDIVRRDILNTGMRIDGRDTKTVRPIVSEVGVLPSAHGSALFTRGETQALVVTTLGTGQDEQIIDGLDGDYREHFMLHYNFPPYSVGEAGRMAGPGRREIGHGKLAWRALRALLPEKEDFPVHYACGVRNHRVKRVVIHGNRLRHVALADGCWSASAAPCSRHCHGSYQGRPRRGCALRYPW